MITVRTALLVLAGTAVLGGCASVGVRSPETAQTYRNALEGARSASPLPADPCGAAGVYPDPVVGSENAFGLGALDARECALGTLQGGVSSYPVVRRDVVHLYNFYNRRAARQQTFMDIGSGITMVGAAGAFEGGISNSTRQAWAIAAFVPIVISQFNAYEPTRELFHGGALALQLITLRYDRYNRALAMLGDPATTGGDVSCAPYVAARNTVVGWAGDASLRTRDPDGVLLDEARRLHTACLALKSREDALKFARAYAGRLGPYLAADYAADVLQLDHAIMGKDRDLRYSPSETLSALIASPLRAADMLLTGQNTKAALDGLKTQVAFSGLNRNLSTIALPPLPPGGAVVAPLSDQAAALGRDGAAREVTTQVQALRGLADDLRIRQQRQDIELQLARDLSEAAAADYLNFTYDAVTNTTTVSLGPKPQNTTVASASTGGGTPPTQ